MTQSTAGDLEEGDEEEDDGLVNGRRKRKVAFLPSLGDYHLIIVAFRRRALTLRPFISRYHPHHLLPWALAAGESFPPVYSG